MKRVFLVIMFFVAIVVSCFGKGMRYGNWGVDVCGVDSFYTFTNGELMVMYSSGGSEVMLSSIYRISKRKDMCSDGIMVLVEYYDSLMSIVDSDYIRFDYLGSHGDNLVSHINRYTIQEFLKDSSCVDKEYMIRNTYNSIRLRKVISNDVAYSKTIRYIRFYYERLDTIFIDALVPVNYFDCGFKRINMGKAYDYRVVDVSEFEEKCKKYFYCH